MQIRDIAMRDFSAWQGLMRQVHALHAENRPDCYRSSMSFEEGELRALIDDPAVDAFVAEIDGTVAGLAVLVHRKPPANPAMQPRRVAFLDDLCVDERFRGQGVGTALLQEVQRRAALRQADSLELMAWGFNESAIRFYQRAGFGVRSLILEYPERHAAPMETQAPVK